MFTTRKLAGSTLAFIGFMLSPLSWWNDAFVNLPLALAFGWLVSLVWRPGFEAGVIVGYWLTNLLGLLLLHQGLRATLSRQQEISLKKELRVDLLISLVYTGVIVLLLRLKILPPLDR